MTAARQCAALMALLSTACGSSGGTETAQSVPCDSAVITGTLPSAINEASGIVISRRTPRIFWVHNDDDPPYLFAIDSAGTLEGRVRVRAAKDVDWEDIAAAPCGAGTCIFLGDIGDNKQSRNDRVVYRFAEPAIGDSVTDSVTAFPFHLPGKSHDAEALFATATGRLFIITKGRSGPIQIFEFPQPLQPGVDVELQAFAALSPGLVQLPDMVTGAGVVPGTGIVAIRTYAALQFYRLDATGLTPLYEKPFDLQPLGEPQGEGIDVRADGTVFLVSEKGMGSAALVSRVKCSMASIEK